jgi:hypothetical protein
MVGLKMIIRTYDITGNALAITHSLKLELEACGLAVLINRNFLKLEATRIFKDGTW